MQGRVREGVGLVPETASRIPPYRKLVPNLAPAPSAVACYKPNPHSTDAHHFCRKFRTWKNRTKRALLSLFPGSEFGINPRFLQPLLTAPSQPTQQPRLPIFAGRSQHPPERPRCAGGSHGLTHRHSWRVDPRGLVRDGGSTHEEAGPRRGPGRVVRNAKVAGAYPTIRALEVLGRISRGKPSTSESR